MEVINPLLDEALSRAGVGWKDVDAVAVTHGPGLVGALLVGVAAAKAIAFSLQIPLVGVNHLEGHIYANYLEEGSMPFPSVVLLVSGGHTSLILVRGHGQYGIIGETRDDAAGEAFDKLARMLGLGYPGGPVIDRLARQGSREAIAFPRPMTEKRDDFEFSFSGLKTAAVNFLRSPESAGVSKEDVCASFQEAVVDVLVTKAVRAARMHGAGHVLLAGGVGRNSRLRERLAEGCHAAGMTAHLPGPDFCTDNAAMIACAGYFLLMRGALSDLALDALPNLPLACTPA
jgi:N6-L-threonylcarbamoyladenine synthase